MYSHKWEKELRGLRLNFHIHVSVSALLYIFPRSVYLFSWSIIGRPIRGIYKSLTETLIGIWDCSSAVPFLGIFVSNFRFDVFAVKATNSPQGMKTTAASVSWIIRRATTTSLIFLVREGRLHQNSSRGLLSQKSVIVEDSSIYGLTCHIALLSTAANPPNLVRVERSSNSLKTKI